MIKAIKYFFIRNWMLLFQKKKLIKLKVNLDPYFFETGLGHMLTDKSGIIKYIGNGWYKRVSWNKPFSTQISKKELKVTGEFIASIPYTKEEADAIVKIIADDLFKDKHKYPMLPDEYFDGSNHQRFIQDEVGSMPFNPDGKWRECGPFKVMDEAGIPSDTPESARERWEKVKKAIKK